MGITTCKWAVSGTHFAHCRWSTYTREYEENLHFWDFSKIQQKFLYSVGFMHTLTQLYYKRLISDAQWHQIGYHIIQDYQSQLSKNYVTLCKFCPSNWCKYGSLMLIRCTQTNRTATTWNWNDQRHFHDHVFCWFITLIGPGNLICSSVSYNIQYTLHKEQLNLWAVPLAAQTSPVYQVTGDRNKDVDVYFALWLD